MTDRLDKTPNYNLEKSSENILPNVIWQNDTMAVL